MLVKSVSASLDELIDLIQQLSNDDYCAACAELGDSSIGEHMRHIIEMFQCLIRFAPDGVIFYDKRNRDKLLETDRDAAVVAIMQLKSELLSNDFELAVHKSSSDQEVFLKSSYQRELAYNLEHCIHHQALIKVGLRNTQVKLAPHFGIAPSTILYRNKCAQ